MWSHVKTVQQSCECVLMYKAGVDKAHPGWSCRSCREQSRLTVTASLHARAPDLVLLVLTQALQSGLTYLRAVVCGLTCSP